MELEDPTPLVLPLDALDDDAPPAEPELADEDDPPVLEVAVALLLEAPPDEPELADEDDAPVPDVAVVLPPAVSARFTG